MYKMRIYIPENISRGIQKPIKRLKRSFFAEMINGLQPFTIFAKSSILDIWLGSKLFKKVLSQKIKFRDWRLYWSGPRLHKLKIKNPGIFLSVKTVSCHWSLSVTFENIRKPDVFLMYSGGTKSNQWNENETGHSL